MADVCEAFRFFRVFSGLIMNICVHSWFIINGLFQRLKNASNRAIDKSLPSSSNVS